MLTFFNDPIVHNTARNSPAQYTVPLSNKDIGLMHLQLEWNRNN